MFGDRNIMKISADFHIHSRYSWDGHNTVEELVHAAMQKGLAAIAITDHDDNRSHTILKKLQPKFPHIILIPGIEFTSREGHILGLGEMDTLPKKTSGAEVIDHIRDNNGVVIIAHPFDRLRSGVGEVAFDWKPDAIEALNASTLIPFFNRKARVTAKKKGIPTTGSSDAHRVSEVGVARTTLCVAENTLEEIFKAIRKGSITPEGRRIGVIQKTYRFTLRKLGLHQK